MKNKFYYLKENEILCIETVLLEEKLKKLKPEYEKFTFYSSGEDVPIPEGYTLIGTKIYPSLEEVKKQKKAEIKSAYENARNDGGDGIFSQVLQAQIDCRADDVLNIKSIVDFKEATGSPQPDFYKLKDNTHFSPCTLEMFKQVYTELIVGQLTWWNKKDMLEKQIDEAQTTEKVQAISWNPIEGESLTV
jgi:hypothetical protein